MMVRAWRGVRWYLPAVLVGIGPLMVVVGANLGVVPLRGVVIARSLAVVTGSTVIVLWALSLLQRDIAARAAWLTWFLLLVNLYQPSVQGLRALGLQTSVRDPFFAVPYVVAIAAVAALASRPWETRPRAPMPFTLAGALLVSAALAPAAAAERLADWQWRDAADAMIAAPLSNMTAVPPVPARDIYYIVLDGMGRADTLLNADTVDLRPLAAALRARGFYVPDGARTNYSQTSQSLASTLNLAYLDDLARVTGMDAQDRAPLHYLIQQNALMRMASRAGYSVVAIGSSFRDTRDFAQADACSCARTALDELELAAIALTPLAALRPARGFEPYTAHRQTILGQLAALEARGRGPRPTFAFAHVMAPHPPFVFARDGQPRQPPVPFTLGDGAGFGGSQAEYVAQYGDQAEYILGRVVSVIDALLERDGPAPVIVVHGDHGPDSVVPWQGLDDRILHDRMAIFAAYHFPGGPSDRLYPTISPVNGARLLARYFGVELPMLDDKSFYAGWTSPYRFVEVAPRDE